MLMDRGDPFRTAESPCTFSLRHTGRLSAALADPIAFVPGRIPGINSSFSNFNWEEGEVERRGMNNACDCWRVGIGA